MNNIILIGMPGSGKSTLGVLLAKALCYDFLDTDLVIQQREGKPLQKIIDERGLVSFREAEREALLSVDVNSTVIATGGSAVYYPDAMEHLKKHGICVRLALPYPDIERRINNITTRGIAIAPGMTLRDIYNERLPLYRQYADVTVNCRGKIERNVQMIIDALGRR